MTFPLAWRGKFMVPAPVTAPVTVGGVLGTIRAALRELRASDVELGTDCVTYRVANRDAFFRMGRMNVLAAFDGGAVTVRTAPGGFQIEYEVSFRRLLWASALCVPILAIVSIVEGRAVTIEDLPLFISFWLLVSGGSVLIALLRYPAFLRRVVRYEIKESATTHADQPRAHRA